MPQDFVQRCKLKSALRYFRIDCSSVIKHQSSDGSRDPPPPFIFRPNWSPKGRKKKFWDRIHTPLPLISGSGWRPPSLIWSSVSSSAKWCRVIRLDIIQFVVGLLRIYFVSPGQADRNNARDGNGDRSSTARNRQGIENLTLCLSSRVNQNIWEISKFAAYRKVFSKVDIRLSLSHEVVCISLENAFTNLAVVLFF